ncbi:MAG: hypothetical protein WD278_07275 [Pirellulales bacterium]
MSTLREFDLQSRGVVKLLEEWRTKHAAVRKVWKTEEVIAVYLSAIEAATSLFDYYRQNGHFPHSEQQYAPFSYFVQLLEQMLLAANELEDVASRLEDEGFEINGTSRLREGIEKLTEVVAEDRFAIEAASASGALDDST